MRRHLASTSCAVALVLLGCGSSEEDPPKEALATYFQALREGNGPEACALATPGYQEHLLRGADAPPIAGSEKLGCEARVSQTRKQYGEARLAKWTDYEVVDAEVDGEDALVTIRLTDSTGTERTTPCPLKNQGGDWKVASDCE